MSGSRASTDSQTSSNTTTTNTDNSQQLGVDGSNNLLIGSGSAVSITNNDISGEALAASIAAGERALAEARRLGSDALTAGTAISGNALALASDSLTRMVESQTEASSLSRYALSQNAQTSQAALEALQAGNSDALTRQLEAQADALSFGRYTASQQTQTTEDALAFGRYTASQQTQATEAALDFGRYVAGGAAAASQAAIEALQKGNSDALTRMLESQSESLGSVRYAVGRSADLSGEALNSANRSADRVASTLLTAAEGQNSLLYKMISSNQELVNNARMGDAALASQAIDKAITGISDSRRDTNEKILTDGFKYAAYAVAAIAGAFGIFALVRRAK